jgi:hypothetical protein
MLLPLAPPVTQLHPFVASPAAVVDASPGTGVSTCPAVSARCRSSPTRKSSPHSCAAAIPTSTCPALNPRSRALIGPTASSSRSITASRSHNSVTAVSPENLVSDSSAPTCTRAHRARLPRTLRTRQVSSRPRSPCRRKQIIAGQQGLSSSHRTSPRATRGSIRAGAGGTYRAPREHGHQVPTILTQRHDR